MMARKQSTGRLGSERGQTLRKDEPSSGVYTVSDGTEYAWEDFCLTLSQALGRSPPAVVPVPETVSYVVGLGSELAARVRGTVPMLSRDKVRELRCPAWTCSTDRAAKELGFTPAIPLAQGLASALADYPEPRGR